MRGRVLLGSVGRRSRAAKGGAALLQRAVRVSLRRCAPRRGHRN